MSVSSGVIALIGSGETAASGGRIFDALAMRHPTPLRVAILETPAGFELNSDRVAGRIAEFLARRLQNYAPQISVIPARRRDDPLGTDNPEILAPLAAADLIFLGPGSPTYAVRQLRATLAWQAVLARLAAGASLALASAAAIAAGSVALPVYEIFKAGEDLHWRDGLDLPGRFGASVTFIPHWDNAEGGSELDTSRCFMGRERFAALARLLPAATTVAGIDEHTTLLIAADEGVCRVVGRGSVTIITGDAEHVFPATSAFAVSALGSWGKAELPELPQALRLLKGPADVGGPAAPASVTLLIERREAARRGREWERADALRAEIEALGWEVRDTPSGPQISPR